MVNMKNFEVYYIKISILIKIIFIVFLLNLLNYLLMILFIFSNKKCLIIKFL